MRHNADEPYATLGRQIRLDMLKVAVAQRIGAQAAHQLAVRAERGDTVLADELVVRLESFLLAEELPPIGLDDVESFTVPRFATWWDHWKATHREKWWMWALRDFGWMKTIRYVDEPHRHRTHVKVRTRWTYPRATTVLPADRFGHVVLKSDASAYGEVTHW